MRLISVFNFRNYTLSWWALFILLLSNFLFRLFIYSNTTLFYFSDYKRYLYAIETINEHGSIPLRIVNSLYLNSYIGYFFKYLLGSIDYYFIFSSLLATLSIFFIYKFITEVTDNKLTGIIAVLFLSIYSEYTAFSSIFYTAIYELFFISIILYLLVKLYRNNIIYKNVSYIIIISSVITFSLFFKGSMLYLWILFLFYSLLNIKNRSIFIKFLSLSISIILFTVIAPNLHDKIDYMMSDKNKVNDFFFYGHTLYGGDGGEGAFIYPENEKLYLINYEKFLIQNNINIPTIQSRNTFQKEEIIKFVKQHPFKWIWLQISKFTRTFGIIPEGNTFKILVSGIFKNHWILTALFLQIPFALIILLFVFVYERAIFQKIFQNRLAILIFLMFIYWILGSVFYGVYQERYRIPIIVSFIIPYISYGLTYNSPKSFRVILYNIKRKIVFLLLITIIWSVQTYHALVIEKARYFKVVGQTISAPEQ